VILFVKQTYINLLQILFGVSMTKWHLKSNRTPTGAKVKRKRKKKKFERGSEFLETKIGPRKFVVRKARGGSRKYKLLAVDKINVADPKTGKIVRSKILSVVDNPANPHYVRRNIITKGAVVKTEAGLARIVSRPGQDGIVNAVLIEEQHSH